MQTCGLRAGSLGENSLRRCWRIPEALIPESTMGVMNHFPLIPSSAQSQWSICGILVHLSFRRHKNISRMIKITSVQILILVFSPQNRKRNTRTKNWHNWKKMSKSIITNGDLNSPLLIMDRRRQTFSKDLDKGLKQPDQPTRLRCLFILFNGTLFPPSAHEAFT